MACVLFMDVAAVHLLAAHRMPPKAVVTGPAGQPLRVFALACTLFPEQRWAALDAGRAGAAA